MIRSEASIARVAGGGAGRDRGCRRFRAPGGAWGVRGLCEHEPAPPAPARVHPRMRGIDQAHTTGRNLGSVTSDVTSSNITSTAMPIRTSAGGQPITLVIMRTPSASSTIAST